MLMRTTLVLVMLLSVTHVTFSQDENGSRKGNGIDVTPNRSTALSIPKKRSANNSLSNSRTQYSPPPTEGSKLLTVCGYATWATRSNENSPRDPSWSH